jgi:ribosomal protein S17
MKSSVYNAIEKLLDNLDKYDMDDLARIAQYRANTLAAVDINIGDRVTFEEMPRTMRRIRRGILVKKNRKNFVVRIGSKHYNVPPCILQKVWY